ncbi:hypothetical protein GO685_04290 [Wolbachia endosymbiont of Madathamugadia hiepei]|uniref:hypothetical protein n=1 Tax=Wolbachia endosymbiont of Madathamugadia hiepei TaxID=1241303 RepID=UPI00158C2C38|nr:hypothetical protein [Wolbachia endosymbiont of Madathamugadia hiepei]NUX01686.1 hypothetical protein [Wolbachia endosymbiont of Madathamugadia hiepei]
MAAPRKRKLPSDFYDVESAKRLKSSRQEIAPLSSKPYPDNFHVGQAVRDGSCFFDSFRQSLEQQTGTQVTVEQLRNDCKKFAQNNPPKWFIDAIANSHDNSGQHRSETLDAYAANIMLNNRWGDPDIEGRILCEKYNVKLHVVEKYSVEGQEIWTNQIVNESKSEPVNDIKYNEVNTIHIINNGESHFEPLLDRKKSLAKQEQEDFLLAKKLQLDEILGYCNISKDSPKKEEVEKTFDELLAKNAGGKISDVVEQCVSDIKQRIQRSEEQNSSSLPRCGMEETKVEKFDQQRKAISCQ